MKKILYYEWELIPKKYMLDNLRFIINNYYNETNFDVFQESLNMNYKSYILKEKNKILSDEMKNLLSKLIIIYFILKRKYWNI